MLAKGDAARSSFVSLEAADATLAEDRHVLNLLADGEIKYCSANPQRVMPLKPPPASAVESLFASVGSPSYLLDLRRAPPGVASWLHAVRDHWNGFGSLQFATAQAYDLVYYVSPVSSACTPPN